MNAYVRGSRTINKVKLSVIDSVFNEFLSVIFRFIQSNDVRHSKMFKNFKIIFSAVSMFWLPRCLCVPIYRTHKCDEFARDNPIEISVLNLLIVFVLSWVKVFKAVPSKQCSDLQALKAVIDLK